MRNWYRMSFDRSMSNRRPKSPSLTISLISLQSGTETTFTFARSMRVPVQMPCLHSLTPILRGWSMRGATGFICPICDTRASGSKYTGICHSVNAYVTLGRNRTSSHRYLVCDRPCIGLKTNSSGLMVLADFTASLIVRTVIFCERAPAQVANAQGWSVNQDIQRITYLNARSLCAMVKILSFGGF